VAGLLTLQVVTWPCLWVRGVCWWLHSRVCKQGGLLAVTWLHLQVSIVQVADVLIVSGSHSRLRLLGCFVVQCGQLWVGGVRSSGSGWVTHLAGCDVAMFMGGGSLLVVT